MMGQLEDTSYSAILYVKLATVAMVTKEKAFLDYHSNRCYDENFLHLFHRALYYEHPCKVSAPRDYAIKRKNVAKIPLTVVTRVLLPSNWVKT